MLLQTVFGIAILKALITLEDHLWRSSDGCIRGHGPTGYSIWSELLDSFEQVVLLARVGNRHAVNSDLNAVEGAAVSVHGLPDYFGPWQYLRTLPSLRSRVREAVAQCDTYLIRVPGLIGRLAWQEVRRLRTPYAAEVMSDPWDTMGSGSMPTLFRPLYREIAARNLRMICQNAVATLYWSSGIMRKRYPSADDADTCVAPRIFLNGGYASPERLLDRYQVMDPGSQRVWRIGFIGSFAQLYKGSDTLLRALAFCLGRGARLEASFAGEGRYRENMESLARDLSLERNVSFLGQLGFGEPVCDFLDSIDLFVMPSRAEGLPRALVEAMARGCPCIGSDIGGIPELLVTEDLVPPNDHKALARKIMEVIADPQRMKAMSERNLARAKQFDPEALRDVRRAFYQCVREHSANNTKSAR